MKSERAFTLIELLIVVAVIGILAAIAVPNMIQARTRAMIGASFGDMKAMGTALEMYAIDWGEPPLQAGVNYSGEVLFPAKDPTAKTNATKFVGPSLTTPVAYMSTLPMDRFWTGEEGARPELGYYFYSNFPQSIDFVKSANGGSVPPFLAFNQSHWGDWVLLACGPDGDRKDINGLVGDAIRDGYYDPSNGLVSNGDVLHSQNIPVANR